MYDHGDQVAAQAAMSTETVEKQAITPVLEQVHRLDEYLDRLDKAVEHLHMRAVFVLAQERPEAEPDTVGEDHRGDSELARALANACERVLRSARRLDTMAVRLEV